MDSRAENECDDDEESKEENLDHQAADDDVLSLLDAVLVFCCVEHAAATTPGQERQNNAKDKELGQPLCWDKRQPFRIQKDNQSSQDHVDRGGVEGRAEK